MNNEIILDIVTLIAGLLTASSVVSTIGAIISEAKDTKYQTKKIKSKLDKQLLDLQEIKKQIEISSKNVEDENEYKDVKAIVENLIDQYKTSL